MIKQIINRGLVLEPRDEVRTREDDDWNRLVETNSFENQSSNVPITVFYEKLAHRRRDVSS
jgi:hypothetical protein